MAPAQAASVEAVPAITAPDPVVTPSFYSGGASGTGFSMIYRFQAIERDGEVYVCGATTSQGPREANRIAQQVLLRTRLVDGNGTVILRDLRYFQSVSRTNFRNGLVGVETNCRSTGVAAGTIDLGQIDVEGRIGSIRVPKR